jgi:hypothetical protein
MLASRCRNQRPRPFSTPHDLAHRPQVLSAPPPCKLLLEPSHSCMGGEQPVGLDPEVLRRRNTDRDTSISYIARGPCMSVGFDTTHLTSNMAAV